MLHETHAKWFRDRALDPILAEKLGISTRSAGDGNWLTVPYTERGRVVNHKYRLTSEKRHRMDTGAPLCLWNHDVLLDPKVQAGEQAVIVTEGEWDAIAAMMAGYTAVVSVPNGASGKATEGPVDPENDAERFSYLWRSRDLLDRVKTFILATDADEPGRVLAAELARRLGPERCRFISYPHGAKDMNDVLIAYDKEGVVHTIDAAKPYPVKSLFRLSDFPTPPELPTYGYGIPDLATMLPVVPQTLTVITGYAGAGKSTLLAVAKAFLMKHQGMNIAAALFETLPKPILERKLRAAMIGCQEHSIPVTRIGEADRVIEERLCLIAQLVDEEDELTLEDFLELCRIAVLRDGVRLIILDPWNELEHKKRDGEGEHEYTNRAIRAIKTFMRRYDVAVWIVVHPRKPDLSGVRVRPPSLYDASGSAHWANKADYGMVIFRPDKTSNVIEAHVVKVRMGLPGKEGTVRLAYDWRTTEYLLADAAAPEDE